MISLRQIIPSKKQSKVNYRAAIAMGNSCCDKESFKILVTPTLVNECECFVLLLYVLFKTGGHFRLSQTANCTGYLKVIQGLFKEVHHSFNM